MLWVETSGGIEFDYYLCGTQRPFLAVVEPTIALLSLKFSLDAKITVIPAGGVFR